MSSKEEQKLLKKRMEQANITAFELASAGHAIRSLGNALTAVSNAVLSRTAALQAQLSRMKLQDVYNEQKSSYKSKTPNIKPLNHSEVRHIRRTVEQLEQQFRNLQAQVEEIKKMLL